MLNTCVAPKLEPAYTEPPFQFLQEANKLYMHTLELPEYSGYGSSRDTNDNKSDSEVECDKRRTVSAKIKHSHLKKNRRNSNPNELSLAQKMFVYKRVMAFKESCTDTN